MNKTLGLVALAIATAALEGCAGTSNPNYPTPTTQNPSPGVTLQKITIAPATPFISIAENRQLFATGVYSDGGSVDITSKVTWSSSSAPSPTNSVAVNSSGIATGLSLGYSVITATAGTVTGAAELIVGTNGYTSSTISILSVPYKSTVIDAAYVPESQTQIQGTYAVQEVNLDADQFSSQFPVPQSLLASIPMPAGFVPNATAANPSSALVAVISYSSPNVQIIDASNLPQFDIASNTIIATFKAPVTTTATFNGTTCMICAAVVNPLNNQLVLSTAEGYFSMDMKAGTFTPMQFAGALPSPSFTLNPVAASPYILSSTLGQTPPTPALQVLDLNTSGVTTLTTLGVTTPYASPINLSTNDAALVDAAANDQTLLNMADPQNPIFSQVSNLGACTGTSGTAFMDMANLAITANANPGSVPPNLYLSQSSGNCFGFEIWPSDPVTDPSQDQYGYAVMPNTPDGIAFLNGSDPSAIASFTSVVDKKNYAVLVDATQNWVAKISPQAVLNLTSLGSLPSGFLVSSDIFNTGLVTDPVIYLPTPPSVVTFSQTNITFGNQGVGTASPLVPITLTNIGVKSITVSGISIQGTNAGDFTETDNCTLGAIFTQSKCVINVTFTPSAVGPSSATLSITDDGGASPQTIVLAGTGT